MNHTATSQDKINCHYHPFIFKVSMPSKAQKLKTEQSSIIFPTVEANPKLLDLLEIATTSARKTIFINALISILPTAFASFDKTPEQLFDIFTTWLGNYNQTFSGINAALHCRQRYILETRFNKRKFISDIGLDWTPDLMSSFFSKVNSACFTIGKS
jgi:hypothetical protein